MHLEGYRKLTRARRDAASAHTMRLHYARTYARLLAAARRRQLATRQRRRFSMIELITCASIAAKRRKPLAFLATFLARMRV